MVTSISKKYFQTVGTCAFAAVLALVSTEASADLLFASTNSNVQLGPGKKVVGSGVFHCPTRQRVVVRFNAECAIETDNPNNWVNVDIRLNGNLLPPTEQPVFDPNALCSGNHTVAIDGWLSGLSSGIGRCKRGNNTVTVEAFEQVPVSTWWIDDVTLTVEK